MPHQFAEPAATPPGHKREVWLFVVVALLIVVRPMASAQELSRVEVGLAARFMPPGWFRWEGRPGATRSNLGAYPALGGAPFVDYRVNRYVWLGMMPELTLNVIPRTDYYPVSALLAGSLRLKAEYPALRSLVPYLLLAPGYSAMFTYDNAGGSSGDGHGFVASIYAGARMPIGTRHSVLLEVGYMHGFQKRRIGGADYAPSYLVVAAGWQMAP